MSTQSIFTDFCPYCRTGVRTSIWKAAFTCGTTIALNGTPERTKLCEEFESQNKELQRIKDTETQLAKDHAILQQDHEKLQQDYAKLKEDYDRLRNISSAHPKVWTVIKYAEPAKRNKQALLFAFFWTTFVVISCLLIFMALDFLFQFFKH